MEKGIYLREIYLLGGGFLSDAFRPRFIVGIPLYNEVISNILTLQIGRAGFLWQTIVDPQTAAGGQVPLLIFHATVDKSPHYLTVPSFTGYLCRTIDAISALVAGLVSATWNAYRLEPS